MFTAFPWNSEKNTNFSEACKSNFSGSQQREALPCLEGTYGNVWEHVCLSQLEECSVLASSGWGPRMLLYILQCTEGPHIKELTRLN